MSLRRLSLTAVPKALELPLRGQAAVLSYRAEPETSLLPAASEEEIFAEFECKADEALH